MGRQGIKHASDSSETCAKKIQEENMYSVANHESLLIETRRQNCTTSTIRIMFFPNDSITHNTCKLPRQCDKERTIAQHRSLTQTEHTPSSHSSLVTHPTSRQTGHDTSTCGSDLSSPPHPATRSALTKHEGWNLCAHTAPSPGCDRG